MIRIAYQITKSLVDRTLAPEQRRAAYDLRGTINMVLYEEGKAARKSGVDQTPIVIDRIVRAVLAVSDKRVFAELFALDRFAFKLVETALFATGQPAIYPTIADLVLGL